ncbi:MAG: lipid-A-disaccharide synthase [Ignavibacteria bacterium]
MNIEQSRNKNIFISAGELSGDLHAADLVKQIKHQSGGVKINFIGLGGDMMKAEGMNLLYHIKSLSTIGYLDVIKKYSFFKKVLKDCINSVKKINPDIIILIDYPGFNLRFAEELRKFYDKKIVYYISPQVWAWHKNRVHKIKKYIDRMLVVFPFEKDFYESYGVSVTYVGHPLVKSIKKFLAENPRVKKAYGSDKEIAILPGSRRDEIKNHLPVLLQTARQLQKEFDIKINISKAKSLDESAFNGFETELKNFNLTDENVYRLILNSDLVLTKAGTSTVECALIGNPFIIFYKTFSLNYYLLKPIVKVNNLGMVNILAKENVIREFIQKDFKAENLLNESQKILTDDNYSEKLTNQLKSVWNILGDEDASANAAKIILLYLKD